MNTIPAFGLGTFRLKEQQVIDSVTNGLELGYRHIDTAQIYGNEAEVGKAIAAAKVARQDLFITTKIWTDNLAKDKLIPSLKESLAKLQMDQVDLTLIHWPAPNDSVAVATYMEALAEAQAQGLTKLIGVSNFTISHLQQAIDAVGADAIATQQIEIHPFLQNHKVVEFARQHGIRLTGYMPLAYGKVMTDPTMIEIAKAHQANAAQIALAWSLQRGFATIPSSTKRANLESNLAAQKIVLTDAEMQAIAKLDCNERLANPDFAPHWD